MFAVKPRTNLQVNTFCSLLGSTLLFIESTMIDPLYLWVITPRNEYHMPIADMLINDAFRHKVISFLNRNAGYNQMFMAKEDPAKAAFRYPVSLVYSSGR